MTALPALLTVDDLADRYGVTARTIRQWRNDGTLPPSSAPGQTPRWNPDVIDAFERAGTTVTPKRNLRAVAS